MALFTATGISDGDRLFADEIIIDENFVTIKSPRLFGGKQTALPIGKLAVTIKRPINGFFDVELTTENGKSVRLHSFTERESKMIQKLVQEKNINAVGTGREDNRPREQKSLQENGEDMMQSVDFLRRVDQRREKVISDNHEQETRVALSHEFKEEASYLVRFYKEADFEIVYDDDEIGRNRKIAGKFTRDCLTKAGRGRIRDAINQMKDKGDDNAYTSELELLLSLIDNIYRSFVYKELDSENKPRFPFGLDQQKIKDQLADQSVSLGIKMSRILSRVDRFITIIGNALKNIDL